jgi:endonuclease IV
MMNVLSIFVALVIMTTGHVHCRSRGSLMNMKTTTVRVENDLKVDTVISFHCRSSGIDLGEKTLHTGQYVEWSFLYTMFV